MFLIVPCNLNRSNTQLWKRREETMSRPPLFLTCWPLAFLSLVMTNFPHHIIKNMFSTYNHKETIQQQQQINLIKTTWHMKAHISLAYTLEETFPTLVKVVSLQAYADDPIEHLADHRTEHFYFIWICLVPHSYKCFYLRSLAQLHHIFLSHLLPIFFFSIPNQIMSIKR